MTQGRPALDAALRRKGKLKLAGEILQAGLDALVPGEAVVLEWHARPELAAPGAPRRRSRGGADVLTPAELGSRSSPPKR